MAQSSTTGPSTAGLYQCPTRIDGHSVLFAHQVTEPLCQKRQRDQYHKCFTCEHNNRVRGTAARPKEFKPGAIGSRAAS